MSAIQPATRSPQLLIRGFSILVLGALLVSVGCDGFSGATLGDDEPARKTAAELAPDGAAMHASQPDKAEMQKGLAPFRRATARYHRLEAAIDDGFEQILPCMSNPDGEGAIGIPYAKRDRFDETINLAEPEILFYEPQKNGKLRLVGGEPVIPIEDWSEDEPPSLFGRAFHRNEEHGLFGLHMWIWRDNPDGVFAFWNPNVSCEFAE